MLKLRLACTVALAGVIWSTGCTTQTASAQKKTRAEVVPTPEGIRNNHIDEPIIIDNPDAFIGLVAYDAEEDMLVGPYYPDYPNKTDSVTIVLDRTKPYTHILYSKPEDGKPEAPQPLEPSDRNVVVVFKKDVGSQQKDAGTMTIGWGQYPFGPNNRSAIVLTNKDDGAGKFDLKRHKKETAHDDSHLGLFRADKKDKYVVSSIEYNPDGVAGRKLIKYSQTAWPVHIRLCVDTTSDLCPTW